MSGMSAPRVKALMVRASLGPTGKPSSANLMAGWNSFAQGSLPYFRCAISSMETTPGMPTDNPPGMACGLVRGLPFASRNMSARAEAGAISRPSKLVVFFVLGSNSSMKAPPPMPDDSGSTRPSTICTAMAASTALPPARSISSPASAASGLAAATMSCFANGTM